ncbi:hypothetical protein DSO57_1035995 [Entomophthora muscae]|uniref:Uncharacterized protein n=1 Tax=Entomophthora muscae TaxID=34485 RepID=A0ACC2TAN8_9FUNG|nr:hypothetical protein DSO57_1035995 [Entomophthora muscae]
MEHSFCKFIPQVIHHTGLSWEIPLGLHGKVFGHHGASHLKPWIYPGLVIPGPEELHILLANLSTVPLTVRKTSPFSGLDELGLPVIQPLALPLIPCNSLVGPTEPEKDQAPALFDNYKNFFAKDDLDLGKATCKVTPPL